VPYVELEDIFVNKAVRSLQLKLRECLVIPPAERPTQRFSVIFPNQVCTRDTVAAQDPEEASAAAPPTPESSAPPPPPPPAAAPVSPPRVDAAVAPPTEDEQPKKKKTRTADADR
jgi:hypothetical protein